IEADRTIVQSVLADELACDAGDLGLLTPVDRRERRAEARLRPRLDLDEHQNTPVQRHQIDLAVATAVVALHDGVALAAQMARREALSARPENLPYPWHGAALHLALKRRNARVTCCRVALPLEQVRHIALLARLELTAEEETTFSEQLAAILEHI